MKTPVCESDVRSGELCASCTKKVAEGSISKLDFEVAQILCKINERHNISNATFYKALDLGRVILVLTKGEVGLLIGKQGIVVSELSSALGKKVRIAQTSGDVKKTVSDIIMPARLLGINRTFHNGIEVSTARIAREDLMVLPLDGKTLEIALKSLLGEETKIVFE